MASAGVLSSKRISKSKKRMKNKFTFVIAY